MAARIVGMNIRAANKERARKHGKKFRTAADWMKEPMFIGACKKVAAELEVSESSLLTKRQASKFMRGTGIVYQKSMNGK